MNKLIKLLSIVFVSASTLLFTSGGVAEAKTNTSPVCYRVDEYTTQTIMNVQSALGAYMDGVFGPASCRKLIAFQEQFGDELKSGGSYGTLGPKTASKLGVKLERKTVSSGTTVSMVINPDNGVWPKNCRVRRCLVLSQGMNKAWYGSSSEGIVVETPVVDNPSKLPKGVYRIGYKSQSGTTDHSGKLELNNYMSFYGDIAFHSVPTRKSDGVDVHSQSALRDTWRESGGCIRSSDQFAEFVFADAKIWTYVYVI